MEFSVLMSVYHKDKPEYLDRALQSVLADQTLRPAEVVLVEDGPLDEELYRVIEKYRKEYPLVTLKLEENIGLGGALRKGMELCTYEWIARMDSDDISKPERFEVQAGVIKRNPELAVVGAWVDEFTDESSNVVSCRSVPETHEQIMRYAKRRSPVNHPVVFIRKSEVLDSGGYQHFSMFEDYHLWCRMLMKGKRFYNIPRSLLYFRSTPETMKRRGGTRYLRSDISFQGELRRMGFISGTDYAVNVFIRSFVRLCPLQLRSFVYRNILRKKPSDE